jgi:DNA modification methylase
VNKILLGDCRETLKTLPAGSVQTCVTSPPYFALRDYGVGGQIGLEDTPDAYVESLVSVFREVRRVLADDGTLWLNLGDSYAGSGVNDGTKNPGISKAAQRGDAKRRPSHLEGIKPKDLIGIPWAVAEALRDPYYTGRITNPLDRMWLASIIDGEGCMFIHKRKVGQSNGQGYHRKNDSYGAGLEVANTHLSILERCKELTGVGTITYQDKESRLRNRNLRLYRWRVQSNEAKEIVREVYDFFVAKKQEARLLLGCPSSGEEAARAHVGLIALHNGQEADIDFPEPKSMYEQGYYLRSDIIWAKPNPMPESVTDRCTKSHEYIFLLSKSAQYYYDNEAIMEPLAAASISRLSQDVENQTGSTRANGGAKSNGNMKAVIRGGNTSWRGERTVPGEMRRDTAYKNLEPDEVYTFRNKRDVWTVTTKPYKEAHFATFPPDLIEPCILAGSRVGDTVLDPFGGSGTTAAVSVKHHRNYVICELNPAYIELAEKRLSGVQPVLFGATS